MPATEMPSRCLARWKRRLRAETAVPIALLGLFLSLAANIARAQGEGTTGGTGKTELAQAAERFQTVLESTQPLLLDGRVDAAIQAIEKAVPEASRTAWEELYLGNVLYDLDPKRSLEVHERAYSRLPDSSEAALELGLGRHRAGNCAGALPLYRSVLLARPGETPLQALVAECLLISSDIVGAVAAWEAAGHASHHTGIDFMIFAVHGELSPWRRRADLLALARAGDRGAAVRLIGLDLRFDHDWWNAERQSDALAYDRTELLQLLGGDSREWKEIQAAIDLADARAVDEARGKLSRAGLLLGPDGVLPVRDELTLQLIPTILGLELESSESLLARFGKELEKRAFGEPGSAEAADVFLGLQPESNAEQSAKFERLAWEKFHLPRFAGAHLAILVNLDRLRFDSEVLTSARRDFPLDPSIAGMAYDLSERDKATVADRRAALIAAILAEYTKLTGAYGQSDSYRLKGYFAALRALGGASQP